MYLYGKIQPKVLKKPCIQQNSTGGDVERPKSTFSVCLSSRLKSLEPLLDHVLDVFWLKNITCALSA